MYQYISPKSFQHIVSVYMIYNSEWMSCEYKAIMLSVECTVKVRISFTANAIQPN